MFRTSVRPDSEMPVNEQWTIQLRTLRHHEGELVSFYGLVYSSTGSVRGSIECHGPACSELLALLQMLSPQVMVVDCSRRLPK